MTARRLSLLLILCLTSWVGAETIVVRGNVGHLVLVDGGSIRVSQTLTELETTDTLVAGQNPGQMLTSWGDDGVAVFRFPASEPQFMLKSPYLGGLVGLTFSPEGNSLLALSKSTKTLVRVNMSENRVDRILPLTGPPPVSMSLSPGGLLITHEKGRLTEVNPTTMQVIRQDVFLQPHREALRLPATVALFLPDNGLIRFLNANTREPVQELSIGAGVSAWAISPDTKTGALLIPNSQTVVLFETESGRLSGRLATGLDPVALTFAQNSRALYVVHRKTRDLSVFDLAGMRELGKLPLPEVPHDVVSVP